MRRGYRTQVAQSVAVVLLSFIGEISVQQCYLFFGQILLNDQVGMLDGLRIDRHTFLGDALYLLQLLLIQSEVTVV